MIPKWTIPNVAASAIASLRANRPADATEVLFYLHPDELEELSQLTDRLSQMCIDAVNDYPEPDIGDE